MANGLLGCLFSFLRGPGFSSLAIAGGCSPKPPFPHGPQTCEGGLRGPGPPPSPRQRSTLDPNKLTPTEFGQKKKNFGPFGRAPNQGHKSLRGRLGGTFLLVWPWTPRGRSFLLVFLVGSERWAPFSTELTSHNPRHNPGKTGNPYWAGQQGVALVGINQASDDGSAGRLIDKGRPVGSTKAPLPGPSKEDRLHGRAIGLKDRIVPGRAVFFFSFFPLCPPRLSFWPLRFYRRGRGIDNRLFSRGDFEKRGGKKPGVSPSLPPSPSFFPKAMGPEVGWGGAKGPSRGHLLPPRWGPLVGLLSFPAGRARWVKGDGTGAGSPYPPPSCSRFLFAYLAWGRTKKKNFCQSKWPPSRVPPVSVFVPLLRWIDLTKGGQGQEKKTGPPPPFPGLQPQGNRAALPPGESRSEGAKRLPNKNGAEPPLPPKVWSILPKPPLGTAPARWRGAPEGRPTGRPPLPPRWGSSPGGAAKLGAQSRDLFSLEVAEEFTSGPSGKWEHLVQLG